MPTGAPAARSAPVDGSVAGAAWGDARDQRETAAYRDYYYDHYTRPAYYGYQYAQPVAPAPVDYSYAVPAGYHYNYYYPTYYGYGYYPSTRQAVYAIPCEY